MNTPTADELRRVAEYWQWTRDLACEHPEVTFSSGGSPPTCSECGRPLRWMSDVQIDAYREQKP